MIRLLFSLILVPEGHGSALAPPFRNSAYKGGSDGGGCCLVANGHYPSTQNHLHSKAVKFFFYLLRMMQFYTLSEQQKCNGSLKISINKPVLLLPNSGSDWERPYWELSELKRKLRVRPLGRVSNLLFQIKSHMVLPAPRWVLSRDFLKPLMMSNVQWKSSLAEWGPAEHSSNFNCKYEYLTCYLSGRWTSLGVIRMFGDWHSKSCICISSSFNKAEEWHALLPSFSNHLCLE